MTSVVAGQYSEIRLGQMSDIRPTVNITPMVTVLSLLADAAGRSQGVPAKWGSAIKSALPAEGIRVLAPLFGTPASNIPHCLTPFASLEDMDFDNHLHHMIALASERLSDEVEDIYGAAMPGTWQSVLNRPGRWISAYAGVMRAAWSVLRPVWRRAQPLLEREIVRVGTATVRGVLNAVMSDLSPRWRYVDGRLLIPDESPERFDLDSRRLVLVPTVSGTGASIFNPDSAGMLWLGYPVPGLPTLWRDSASLADDPLSIILGAIRAQLLRTAGSMRSMSALAESLHCVPSVITYHCTQLVDAGLLYRERRGRQIHVRRTERGTALLDVIGSRF